MIVLPDDGHPVSSPCPICGKPAREDVAPFCSKRCADVDLHRWLGGTYAIPEDESGQPDLSDDG